MSKMIQVRHVPDSVHRKLKSRAALAGIPLSDYLLTELKRVAEKPTIQEMAERLGRREQVEPAESSAQAVRAEREKR